MNKYEPKQIEPKWQKVWAETGLYVADLKSPKPKYVAMSMFNYPSGAGIHIGHAMNYTISDVKARFKRQQSYESYHPVGWDAFGLPAENYAIKAKVSPQKSMAAIIPSYRKQYKAMGWSNDWQKEISTHEPEYYKWTQWIFAEMHKHGLAYQDIRLQWWCDKCQTVLADEQVIDDKCWRHDGPEDPVVKKREVKQWFLKITQYADELLEAIDGLDWSASVKLAQKNWIGRSVGAEVTFKVKGLDEAIKVFTTRPDTLFGATFLVLAPEHDLLPKIVSKAQASQVDKYIKESTKKSEVERQASQDKNGVFSGAYATNPVNGEEVPIWVADYVLGGYGTGAIMAVPAHDLRDFEFAQKFKLPIRPVVEPLFTQAKGNDAFRPKEAVVERSPAVCIVKHWQADKYLCLSWKQLPWQGFVVGGPEGKETLRQAGEREIREETGYKNLRFIKELDGTVHSRFYQALKEQNRLAHFKALYFELKDDRQETVAPAEQEIHDVHWVKADEVADFLSVDDMRLFWQRLREEEEPWVGEGIYVNSGLLDGKTTAAGMDLIIDWLEKKGSGQRTTQYRLRDWSVSRQRYWGAPVPIINCPKCGPVLVPDKDLPVVLPELKDFEPSGDGQSALARAKGWVKVDCPKCDGPAERETDTLDTYLDSAWYMFRYFDPHNQNKIFDSAIVNKWLPIDFYNGADHATAHLLYARFISRFFTKIGLIKHPEPFKQMFYNGKVTAADGSAFSKSKETGIDPLEIINSGYGADALRLYLMFAAPLDMSVRWDPRGVPGTYRFLNRLWNLVREYLDSPEVKLAPGVELKMGQVTNRMIKKMTEDIEANRYNTAIAAAMGALNDLYKLKLESFGKAASWRQALEAMICTVAPFAPHIAEELWAQLGNKASVHKETWPTWDRRLVADKLATIVVQINGKLRANLSVAAGSAQKEVETQAKADPKVKDWLKGKKIIKTVFVANRLLNFVVEED